MGTAFGKEEEKTPDVDWEALEGELLKVMKRPDHDDGTLGPILLRLAWHSSGTYDAATKTGGSNGATMRHAVEGNDPENKGLDKARNFLEPVKKKFPNISYADLWVFAAYVFLEASGGPKMVFVPGRKDKGPEHAIKPGRLPEAEHGVCPGCDKEGRVNGWQANAHHVRKVFYRMGMNDQEITALLCGGHVYGRCHTENSGYAGPWVVEPWRFSNEYAEDMVNDKWVVATHQKLPDGIDDETVRPSEGKQQYVGYPADEEDEEDEMIPDVSIAEFPLGKYAVDTTWVNIRETPETNSPIMGRPKTGEVFNIVAVKAEGKAVRGRLAVGGWVSLRGSGGMNLFKREGDLSLPIGQYRIMEDEVNVYMSTSTGFQLDNKSDRSFFKKGAVVDVREIVPVGKEVYGKLDGGMCLRLVSPGQKPFYERIERGWNENPRSLRFADIKTQMMLVSDMILLWDEDFKKHLEVYAEDEDQLRSDFGKAFKKLTELGHTQFPPAVPLAPFHG